MVLQLLTSVAYEIVQASWRTATVLVPVFLALKAVLAYKENDLDNFSDRLIDDSRTFVAAIVLLGSISVAAGVEIPRFSLIGDLIAVVFFGFLFWKF